MLTPSSRPLTCALLLAAAGLSACSAPASERVPAAPIVPQSAQSALESALALQRGRHQRAPEHDRLDTLGGDWDVRVYAMVSVGGEPEEVARGGARISWTLGRKFLNWDLELRVGDEAQSVQGYFGYDVVAREYQALWLSDFATGMAIARGDGSLQGRGLVLYADAVDARGRRVPGARSVLRLLDPENFVIERVGKDANGSEGVLQRTTYTRHVAAP